MAVVYWNCGLLLICSFSIICVFHVKPVNSQDAVLVSLDLKKGINVVEKQFLSLGMDSNLIRDRWETFDFSSTKLRTLASAFAPTHLRLMGSDGDRMIFVRNQTSQRFRNLQEQNYDGFPFPPTSFNITQEDWDNINRFTADVGWKILFGINAQNRIVLPDGSTLWNPINALELLEYSIQKGYHKNLDFEFGNEPDIWYGNPDMHAISPKQLAKEFAYFRSILNQGFPEFFNRSILVGPDVCCYLDFLYQFLSNVDNNTIDAITWHHYYGGEELKYVENYTDPKILDSYKQRTLDVIATVKKTPMSHLPIWQGETSSTYAPPGNNIDETYVAGFMLIDKLGLSAQLGLKLVVRQTFYGFWFALVNSNLDPTPNYWAALLYKRIVGNIVLDISVSKAQASNAVRLYASCTSTTSMYSPGSIVAYGMNLNQSDVHLQFANFYDYTTVHLYLFTPGNGNLTSTDILLNGVILQMINDGTLPPLKPWQGKLADLPKIPKQTYFFLVFVNVLAEACM